MSSPAAPDQIWLSCASGCHHDPKDPISCPASPHDNVLSIAPLDIGDRVLVTLGQLRTAAAESGRTIGAVERMALFYVSIDPRLGNPRQLYELCVRAVERLFPGEVRLRYDHLFSPGNPENKVFWVRWQMHHRSLVGRFVDVSD
jgi:hypothetical protein